MPSLLESSAQLYRELIRAEALDCEWETRGLLSIYESRSELDAYARTDELLRTAFNLPGRRFDGDALTELEPALPWHGCLSAHEEETERCVCRLVPAGLPYRTEIPEWQVTRCWT